MHKKLNLPSKICATCGLSFVWRKKWGNRPGGWENVKYCSERCRRNKK